MGLGFFLGGAAEGLDRSANTVVNAVNQQRQLALRNNEIATQAQQFSEQMGQKSKEMEMQDNINKFNQWKGTLEVFNNAVKTAKDLPPFQRGSSMKAMLGNSPYIANNPALKQLIDEYPDEPEFQEKIAKITQAAYKDLIIGKDVLPHILSLKGMGVDTSYFEKEIGYKASQQVIKLLSEGVQESTGMMGRSNLQRDFNMPTNQGLLMGSGQPNLQEKTVNRPATLGDFTNVIPFIGENDFARKLLERKFVPKEDSISGVVTGDTGDVTGYTGLGKLLPLGRIGKTKDTTGQEFKLDEKTLRIKKQAAGLAAQELAVKYGRDVMAVDPITGMSGVNPNYGTPDQRNAIFKEWQTLSNKHLPQSLKTEIPKETVKPQGKGKIPIFK